MTAISCAKRLSTDFACNGTITYSKPMVLVSRSRAARVGEIEPVRPAKEKIEGDWHHWHRHPDDVQFGVINLSGGIFVEINSTGHYTHIPYSSSLALMVSTCEHRSRSSQISGTSQRIIPLYYIPVSP